MGGFCFFNKRVSEVTPCDERQRVDFSEKNDYELFVEKMKIWEKRYLIDNGSRTSERQKATLQILLMDPTHDLYRLSSIGTGCPFCAPREGRVYSRSGKDPDFPPLAVAFQKIDKDGPDVLWNTYLVTHPNTVHSICSWTPATRTDEEIAEIKRFSNLMTNPLTNDPRTAKVIQATRNKETGRKKWLRSYKLFESCCALELDKFPKTFQTFQKHKLENSEKYQAWMRQYSIIKQSMDRKRDL